MPKVPSSPQEPGKWEACGPSAHAYYSRSSLPPPFFGLYIACSIYKPRASYLGKDPRSFDTSVVPLSLLLMETLGPPATIPPFSLLPQAWHFWVLRSQLKLSFFRQVELKCCVHNLSLPVLSSSQTLGPPESRFLSYCFVFLFPRMGASWVLRHGLYRTLNLTAPQRLERRFTWLLPWRGGMGSAGKSNPNEFFKILSHHISKIFKQHPLIHFASFLCFVHLPFFLTFEWQF